MRPLPKLATLLAALVLLSSHDMFLKLGDYRLAPNAYATVELVNGTFAASENVIDRNRMRDVSLVAAGRRAAVDTAQWTEYQHSTLLNLRTGDAGTYLLGVSTRARDIAMDAAAFNDYLEHDGVLDELQWRRDNDALGQDAVERYAKHVKTVFQVGGELTEDYATVLGYPVEFVPLQNPYSLGVGDVLPVRLLRDGAPLADQPVLVGTDGGHGHDHDHDHAAEHSHDHGAPVRTDAEGIIRVKLANAGAWHLRTIHMDHPADPALTHASNWATLTFGVGGPAHDHDHGPGADHDHDHDGGFHLHAWQWWALSLALIAALFFYFNRQR